MATEEYSIGYQEGHQAGWNAAMESLPAPVQQEPVAAIQEVIGCFNAALAEGLQEALANTTDERLKDLVERRLMHAFYAASLLNDPIAAIRARSNT